MTKKTERTHNFLIICSYALKSNFLFPREISNVFLGSNHLQAKGKHSSLKNTPKKNIDAVIGVILGATKAVSLNVPCEKRMISVDG